MKQSLTILILSLFIGSVCAQNNLHNAYFIENKGQVNDQFGKPNPNVLYTAAVGKMKISLRKNGFSYELFQSDPRSGLQSLQHKVGKRAENPMHNICRVDVLFGQEPTKILTEIEASQGMTNYILPAGTFSNVSSFRKVTYVNAWKNVDIEFLIDLQNNQSTLKYNFIVHSGASLSDVKFTVNGVQNDLIRNGGLMLKTPFGTIEDRIPYSFISNISSRSQREIPVQFVALGNNQVGLALNAGTTLNLGSDETLVVDPTPTLLWGTYYGGNSIDIGNSVSTDNNGNVYVGGITASTNNISTIGVFQSALQSFADGFVVKFNANGTRQWATYYGGNDATFLYNVVPDNSGGAIIFGETYATTAVAMIPSHQPGHGNPGGLDCFMARLNASGGRTWGTYYGGDGDDYSHGLAFDGTSIYIVGETPSTNNIATLNSHKVALTGGNDGFIAKFNLSGNRQWGTYYGGDGGDIINGVAIDKSGNVCFGGTTNSLNGISTANVHQLTLSNDEDGFVAKMNSAGVRQWGTYYGGTNQDNITSVSIDTAGNVLCSGGTQSLQGISSPCVHRFYAPSYIVDSEAAFLININGTSGKRNWGSYFGPESTLIRAISGDKKGNVYIAGQAFSDSLATPDAFRLTKSGEADGFFGKFNDKGLLEWASYYGGNGDLEEVNGMSVDATNQIYLTGSTSSTNGIATVGAHQTVNSGNPVDAFVAKFRDSSINIKVPAVVTAAIPNFSGSCVGIATGQGTAIGNGGLLPYTYLWSSGETTATAVKLPAGVVTVTVSDANGCFGVATATIPALPTPTANAGPDVTICNGSTANLLASGGGNYLWSNGTPTASNPVQPIIRTNYRVTVTGPNGCRSIDSVLVNVNASPIANAGLDTSICQGRPVTLRALGGGTYRWSTNATTQSITVTPATTTSYTVTVTSSNLCTSSDVVVVNVVPIPAANAGADKVVCLGNSVGLTATGGTNYLWDNGMGGPSISVAPTTTTTYVVTVSNGNCSATDAVVVEVIPLPKANAGFDQTVCNGDEAVLTATGGTNYLWDTGDNTPTIKVKPLVSSIYIVTVFSNGCSARDTVVVNVNQLPEAKAGIGFSVCQSTPFQLTASGGVAYKWSTGASTDTTTLNEITSGLKTYTVTVTDSKGCSASDQITVNVLAVPFLSMSPTANICRGDLATVIASSNGTNFIWNSGETNNVLQVSPAITTTYTVTVTGNNGCKAVGSSTVNVFDKPVADAGQDQVICTGSSTILSASGGASYIWSNGEKNQKIEVKPAATSTYVVTVSAGSCASVDTVIVTVNPLPIANAGTDQSICQGASTSLTASGGVKYEWNNGASTPTINIMPFATTTYTVTVEDSNGCKASDVVIVVVNTLPNVKATAVNNAICIGNTAELLATGGVSYQWSTGGTSASQIVSPLITTTYAVTATDANGCSDAATVAVIVNPLPNAKATPEKKSICLGSSVAISGAGGTSFVWSTGSSAVIISVSPTTNTQYVVTVTDANGCKNKDSVTIVVNPLPTVIIRGKTNVCAGTTDTLSANGGTAYVWSTNQTAASIFITPTSTTTYSVTATDNNGCTASSSQTVVVNPLPVVDLGTDTSTVKIGQTLTLDGGTPGSTYVWSNGATTQKITVKDPSANYCVTVTNTFGCTASDCIFVKFLPNALHEIDDWTAVLAPNPASTIVTLKGSRTLKSAVIQILSLDGRILFTENFTGNEKTLSVEHLTDGIYYLTVKSDGNVNVYPLLVQH